MLGNSLSYTTVGIDAKPIAIECDTTNGLWNVTMVGLPTGSVKESSHRVMAAIKNSGWDTPNKRYTINLAPADLKKESASLDLPIAIAILMALKELPKTQTERIGIVGELSLDGNVRAVKGVLPIAIEAKKDSLDALIVPYENAEEAAIIEDLKVIPVTSLRETANYLMGKAVIPPKTVDRESIFSVLNESPVDMADVKGQFQVKRALEVAAAGGHNILMIGPPGSGKTMLARRVPTILPELSLEEALEATKIHSVCGHAADFVNGILTSRPFRSPHHTISDIAILNKVDINFIAIN